MKEEALKLADQLDGLNSCEPVIIKACETMIRKLIEENDRLTRDLIGASLYEHDYKTLIEKLKPLSDDEIESIYYKDFNFEDADMVKFARAIEERHGIK